MAQVDEHDGGDEDELGDEERRMLANIVALGGKRVDDVMVPRGDIVALEASLSLPEIVAYACGRLKLCSSKISRKRSLNSLMRIGSCMSYTE